MNILGADGKPLPLSPEEVEKRRQHTNELMDKVQALFVPPFNSADYLTVGINMMQAYIFFGPVDGTESRIGTAMMLLDSAIANTISNMELKAKVAAGIKVKGVIH